MALIARYAAAVAVSSLVALIAVASTLPTFAGPV